MILLSFLSITQINEWAPATQFDEMNAVKTIFVIRISRV